MLKLANANQKAHINNNKSAINLTTGVNVNTCKNTNQFQ